MFLTKEVILSNSEKKLKRLKWIMKRDILVILQLFRVYYQKKNPLNKEKGLKRLADCKNKYKNDLAIFETVVAEMELSANIKIEH